MDPPQDLQEEDTIIKEDNQPKAQSKFESMFEKIRSEQKMRAKKVRREQQQAENSIVQCLQEPSSTQLSLSLTQSQHHTTTNSFPTKPDIYGSSSLFQKRKFSAELEDLSEPQKNKLARFVSQLQSIHRARSSNSPNTSEPLIFEKHEAPPSSPTLKSLPPTLCLSMPLLLSSRNKIATEVSTRLMTPTITTSSSSASTKSGTFSVPVKTKNSIHFLLSKDDPNHEHE
eukprot:TRINITY_DN15451_c0_g1_i1.p1 TRINITY_DN15451_c0_g1~~TRINITY_DN15451_c0_g1_i1.p1  ORF type:complete len:243 (+),score=60.18 TRINITY_DN15451_c0_g1_i1:48-731(+)